MAAAAQRQFALVHVEPVVIAGVRIDQIDDRIVDAALFRFEASHAIEPIAGMPIEPSRFHRSSPRRNVPPWYAPATPFPGAGPARITSACRGRSSRRRKSTPTIFLITATSRCGSSWRHKGVDHWG